MSRRWLPVALSLLLLLVGPGWAPAAFEARGRGPIDQPPELALHPAPPTAARAAPAAAAAARAADPLADYTLYVPTNAATRQPLRVLVALHGMGGNGADFARSLIPLAERQGWVVLAPTLPYRDFRDPELVRRDGELHPRLKALLDILPAKTGLQLRPRVLMYGFSRGSQEAHRFSFMYPESTLGVAGLSAGSYTLPSKTFKQNAQDQALRYPFGTADVDQICGRAFNPEAARQVAYWIGVGGRDNRVEDVPRQWDPYVGQTRVERAQRFVAALDQLGARAHLAVFPAAAHELTDPMREDAMRFLASLSS